MSAGVFIHQFPVTARIQSFVFTMVKVNVCHFLPCFGVMFRNIAKAPSKALFLFLQGFPGTHGQHLA